MNIQGKIKLIGATEQVSDKFRKKDLVITTEGQYPQDIILQLTQDKCSLLDSFKVGDQIKVHYNLYGKSWDSPDGKKKYFNTLVGWKCEKLNGTEPSTPAVESSGDKKDDDLPF